MFWYFGITTLKNPSSARFQSRYAWDESFPVLTRLKNDLSPGSIPILSLILSWIYPGPDPRGPISLPSRSCWYPDFTPALVLILSNFYPYPDAALVLACSGQKENLVLFQVPDALWLSLDNDFPSVLEEYLWYMTCDNMTFDRNFRRTWKLLFLTKNWPQSLPCSNPSRKRWFLDYFVYLYLNDFYISLQGKSLCKTLFSFWNILVESLTTEILLIIKLC